MPAALLLLQVEVAAAGVGGLPNWLRGFDSRRPLWLRPAGRRDSRRQSRRPPALHGRLVSLVRP